MSAILIASGGSGGHLAPAIALGQRLVDEEKVWIGTSRKEVDQRLANHYPELKFLDFEGVALQGSLRQRLAAIMHTLADAPRVVRTLADCRVERIVATGGFGCAPVLFWGSVLGLRIQGHESNAVVGKVHRLFRCLYERFFLTMLKGQAVRANEEITGFPIRRGFGELPSADAKLRMGLVANRPLITFMGGSQGASALNQAFENCAKALVKKGYQVVCVYGPGNQHPAIEANESIRVMDFVSDMNALLQASDLVISRSGAGTIAELAALETPVVLVPLPGSAEDHQRLNARRFADFGCALFLEQKDLEHVCKIAIDLLGDRDRIERMCERQKLWYERNNMDNMMRWIRSQSYKKCV